MMHKKPLLAIISTFFIGGLLVLFNHSNSELGNGFVVASFYMMLRYATLVGGIVLLFAYIFFRRKISSSFIFIFLATFNLAVCFSAFVLFFLRQANLEWLHDCLLNGLVGVVMIVCTQLGKR